MLARAVLFQSVCRVQFFLDHRFLFASYMIQHVPPLVNLAALDRRRFAGMLLYRRGQRLAAVQNVETQPRETERSLQSVT